MEFFNFSETFIAMKMAMFFRKKVANNSGDWPTCVVKLPPYMGAQGEGICVLEYFWDFPFSIHSVTLSFPLKLTTQSVCVCY